MTAEIAVMNRAGVALAADSAVTIGNSGNKIYTSAEKLFQLSSIAPVGIMVYGNAAHVSLPWETIIKTFRRKCGNEALPTIGDYRDRFAAFLRDNPELFPKDNRLHVMRHLVHSAFAQVLFHRRQLFQSRRKDKGAALTPQDRDEVVIEAINVVSKNVEQCEPVDGLNEDLKKQITEAITGSIDEIIDDVFENTPVPASAKVPLHALAIEHLCRKSLRDDSSGIVIAGFGEDEYMPSLASFEVEECADVLPRLQLGQIVKISPNEGRSAFVMPYAQSDSVFHFLLGVDTDLSAFMQTAVQKMTDGTVDTIFDKIAEANTDLANGMRDSVKKIAEENVKQLFEAWDEEQTRYFRPMLGTIAVLPKDELAAMAESFVNLTKFRRRVTPVPETVSGPIDVAVITKGDGFVWIRRKHYFSPEMNPRVMARLNQIGGGMV